VEIGLKAMCWAMGGGDIQANLKSARGLLTDIDPEQLATLTAAY
jgi:hypothetical protein